MPARYSDHPTLFAAGGALAPDVVLVQVSLPGPEGRFSLGVTVGSMINAVRSAPLVIAQVNRQMPYTRSGRANFGETRSTSWWRWTVR